LFTLKGIDNYYKYLNNIVTNKNKRIIVFEYPIEEPVSMKFTFKDKDYFKVIEWRK
jgi:hypothetical protein